MTPALVRAIPHLEFPGTAAAFIAAGTSQLGYREGSNNDNIFGVWYGMNHESWCAIYISWVAKMSGCSKIIPRAAFTEAMAQWFIDRKQWHNDTPKAGDIGFIWDQSMVSHSRPRGIHHVFGVRSTAGTGVLTFEGNTNNTGSAQGNGVYSLRRSSRIRGYGRPNYAALPKIVAPPKVKLADVQTMAHHNAFTGPVGTALQGENLPPTRNGYAKWQQREGYSGHDANGIPGLKTLTDLGRKHHFTVIP